MEPSCPFCAPAIRRSVFAESDGFLALYNIAPILPGHALVIPRAHRRSLMDLDAAELAEFTGFARETTGLLLRAFAATGFDWSIQDGTEAGQTVPHLHLHIIPRASGDLPDPGDWYLLLRRSREERIDEAARPRLSDAEMDGIVAHLRGLAEPRAPR